MESATWCRTPAAASAARRLRPEVSKNSSNALSSNEGELARSITTCVPARASLRPSPVMVLTPVLGEAATTSWPPWRRMGAVFEPIRPVPPIMTIFIPNLLVRSPQAGVCDDCAASRRRQRLCQTTRETESVFSTATPRFTGVVAERYHVQSRLANGVGRWVLQRDRRGESGDSAENFTPHVFGSAAEPARQDQGWCEF